MAYCVNCGNEIKEDYVFCPECGFKVGGQLSVQDSTPSLYSINAGPMIVCRKCGAKMPADAIYCFECGYTFAKQYDDFEQIQKRIARLSGTWKNKWIALFLCVFFGWLGIHRFYEGKVVTGILYFFTIGVFGIGWIVDIIRIALKPNPYRTK